MGAAGHFSCYPKAIAKYGQNELLKEIQAVQVEFFN